MDAAAWLSIAAVCITGAASPGPSLAVVVRNTVRGGRLEGVLTGLGHGIGVGIYAFGAVVGISAIVANTPGLQRAIEVAGALFLLWMGVTTLRHAGEASAEAGGVAGRRGFVEGFLVSFLNPKIAVFFLALLGSFLPPEAVLSERAGVAALAVALGCAVAATDDVAPWLWPAVFLLAASGLLWLVWRAPAVQVRRMGPPASVRLRAGPAGLEHQVGERRAVWSWDAVLRVVDRPEGVYVMLASGASVFVPARQRRPGLGARLEAWRLGGQPASTSLPSAPEGHDELSLRYRATRADYAAYLLAVEARRRTVWWGVGAGALIVAAAWADRGLDLLTLGAVGVIELHDSVDVPAVTAAAIRHGVWVRPFRNLVYTMPPYISTAADVEQITTGMTAAVAEVHERASARSGGAA